MVKAAAENGFEVGECLTLTGILAALILRYAIPTLYRKSNIHIYSQEGYRFSNLIFKNMPNMQNYREINFSAALLNNIVKHGYVCMSLKK